MFESLPLEAPFRIGDWIDIDTLAQGKVIEIGWRTTRLQTLDVTYMILPNSQIARQRITNFSAPKREFRAQISITLDHALSIGRACKIMLEALSKAQLIQQDPAPDIRVRSYDEGGINYTARYWVPRFERAADCRDEVYSLIDDALRRAGSIAPYRRIQLVGAGQDVEPEGAVTEKGIPQSDKKNSLHLWRNNSCDLVGNPRGIRSRSPAADMWHGCEISAKKVDFLSRPKSAEGQGPKLVDRDDENPF